MACLRFRVRWAFVVFGFVFASGIGLFVAVEIAKYDSMPLRYMWNLRQLIGW